MGELKFEMVDLGKASEETKTTTGGVFPDAFNELQFFRADG
jgi:hypothetical protein